MEPKVTKEQLEIIQAIVKDFFDGRASNLAKFIKFKSKSRVSQKSFNVYAGQWHLGHKPIKEKYAKLIVEYVNSKTGKKLIKIEDISPVWTLER